MSKTTLIVGLMLASVCSAQGQQSDIQVEQLGEGMYRLVLKSLKSTDVAAGQQELLSEARRLCGNKGVRFGRYEFQKSEAIRAGAPDGPLLLKQEIHCGEIAGPPAAPPAASAWRPTEEQQQQIQSQTYEYFAAKDTRDYKQAYAFWSTATPFEQWSSAAEKFDAQAGQVRNRVVKKITWYKDPPQAPAPGVYAAADFSSQFANIEIHCGFVVWYQGQDGRFRVIREEQNYIDKVMQQKLAPNDLAAVRAKFGC
jgi:hypothetical protein